MKITAIIPTLNEEIHIEEAIATVSFADEIIVIDSFSTDKTVDLIKQHAQVRLIQRVFDDFSSQKNFAISKASHDWIYILDADERISPLLEEEILNAVKNPQDCVGFYVRRNLFFLGKKLRYGGVQREKVVRLFLKEYCQYNGDLVHEVIQAKGKLCFLKNRLDHFTYRNYDHFIEKMNHYAALKAKQLQLKGQKVNLYHLLVKPAARFLIHYILRLGFLDGLAGLVFAKTQAYGVLTRYLKLRINNKDAIV